LVQVVTLGIRPPAGGLAAEGRFVTYARLVRVRSRCRSAEPEDVYVLRRSAKCRRPADDKPAFLGDYATELESETQIPAVQIRAYLSRLELERLEAKSIGLGDCPSYMSDLDEEIAHCRSAYVGTAVIEIAVFRGELSGRQAG